MYTIIIIIITKANERLHDITPNDMVLAVSVSPKNKCKKRICNTHLILIRLQENCIFRGQ